MWRYTVLSDHIIPGSPTEEFITVRIPILRAGVDLNGMMWEIEQVEITSNVQEIHTIGGGHSIVHGSPRTEGRMVLRGRST